MGIRDVPVGNYLDTKSQLGPPRQEPFGARRSRDTRASTWQTSPRGCASTEHQRPAVQTREPFTANLPSVARVLPPPLSPASARQKEDPTSHKALPAAMGSPPARPEYRMVRTRTYWSLGDGFG
jgi:hypothetical protein